MPKFPVDAPKAKVVGALEALGFEVVREANHIKGSTLRTVLMQAGIGREEFLSVYRDA